VVATLDRLERLTDLVLVLLSARSPCTLEQIAAAVPGYPASPAARRQAFERDKKILREEGIPVVAVPIEGPEQYGYRIDPDAFYLPDLDLTFDEQAALHLAVAGVSLGDPSGRDALAKLGTSGVADVRPLAQVDAPRTLVPLFDAMRCQAEVRFTYHRTSRAVAPASLQFRAGRWYLVGWDRAADDVRTYRVDRIESLHPPGPAGSGVVPEGFVPSADVVDPWGGGADAERVQVRVDAVEGPRVVAEVGERAVRDRAPDGSVLLELGVSSFEVLRSWVLGLLDHAEVIGPPAAREAVVSWLTEIAAPRAQEATDRPPGRAEEAGSELRAIAPAEAALRSRGGRARERLRRLLAIVSLLAEAGEASIAELATRFDMTSDEVVRELELAACCGIPPYSPDTLLEIVVTGEKVQAFLPTELARPRRLTPAEGLALAAAARTILAVPGADPDGALARALRKLETVIGDYRRLVVQIDAPLLLEDVRALVAAGEQATIVYHSASADETTERVVEPLDLVSLDGHWYLDAYCHKAEGVRRFRVDRIRELHPLGTPAALRAEVRTGAGAFVPGPGAQTVVVELDGDARWVADSVPVLGVREKPGSVLEVALAVGGRAWLERLLLQAGPRARVVSPPELMDAGAFAASRLLRARYGYTIEIYERA
jgi:predicted DNA-binding transcriptional regulator YafY